MLSHDAKWMLDRAMDKAKMENHELLVMVFDRSVEANEKGEALEVVCSMRVAPEIIQGMAQEALGLVAEGHGKLILPN